RVDHPVNSIEHLIAPFFERANAALRFLERRRQPLALALELRNTREKCCRIKRRGTLCGSALAGGLALAGLGATGFSTPSAGLLGGRSFGGCRLFGCKCLG